ncbi:tail fiber domain-containing protein [Candidatus Woesearchaeota archaeon]|nr:tail fiber domain-containing protein [Candidatus Woesearchaeota archaeon]
MKKERAGYGIKVASFFPLLKSFIAIALAVFMLPLANAEDVVVENGKIGVGMTSTPNKLTVAGVVALGSTNDGAPAASMKHQSNVFSFIGGASGYNFYDSTGVTSQLAISNAGNIGIGIATPNYKLEIIGDAGVKKTGEVLISLNNAEQNGRNYMLVSAGSAGGIGVGKFSIYDKTADLSRLTIDASGNVGIGTVTPAEKLEVNGNVQAAAYYYSSDALLKTNINPLNGLGIISNLHGVSFDWKENGNHDMGLVAQDVEKVLPELVTTNSNGMKSVKYGSLIAPLIEAVKELGQQNTNQSKKIKELEQQIAKLQDEINELKE